MLGYIKNEATSGSYDYIAESIADDDLRDTFLDDPEAAVIGAENDPGISKFIESIPEDDELEPLSNKDIEKIAAEAYEGEADSAIDDYISSGNYSEISEFDELPMTEADYNPESDSAINDYISSGNYSEGSEFDETPMGDPAISGNAYSDEDADNIDDYISSGNYSESSYYEGSSEFDE